MGYWLTYGAAVGAIVMSMGVMIWRVYFRWVKYDLEFMKLGAAIAKEYQLSWRNQVFLIDLFEASVKKFADKPFLIYEDKEYTFKYVDDQANRVANSMTSLDIKKGDVVGIMIHNEPEFVWTYLGLLKMGIVPALINYNTKKEGLLRCVRDTEAKILIVGKGEELLDSVNDVKADLGIPVYIQGQSEHIPATFHSFDKLTAESLPVSPSKDVRKGIDFATTASYIFTSGTTGLPKAACLPHVKNVGTSCLMTFGSVSEKDVIYVVLPLYHTSGMIGLSRAMRDGCTVVLRKKFSVTNFWRDCRKHGVTVVSYVGEVLRYLLTPPERADDKDHNVRLFLGNGLRKDIWEAFQTRFGVKQILEFYGATESTTFYINVNNKPGALGRHSPLVRKLGKAKQYLVKYDVTTAQPIRDESGRCIETKCGEVGLLINMIQREHLASDSEGFYKNRKEDSEKKLMKNCFTEGDTFYNTGDTMYMDEDYFLYFHDRLGDTFRWKGENVSTTEVANSLKGLDFIEDINVYGVQIPGCEGRAGMAAIFLKDKGKHIDEEILWKIQKAFETNLPKYARPLFLRFPKEMHLTATFKQQKGDLRKEGYDPSVVQNPLFYKGDNQKQYEPLTQELFNNINKGR